MKTDFNIYINKIDSLYQLLLYINNSIRQLTKYCPKSFELISILYSFHKSSIDVLKKIFNSCLYIWKFTSQFETLMGPKIVEGHTSKQEN